MQYFDSHIISQYAPGQQWVLQDSCLKSSPRQRSPPFCGCGLSHLLSNLFTPPTPQETEHSPEANQSPQPPWMTTAATAQMASL